MNDGEYLTAVDIDGSNGLVGLGWNPEQIELVEHALIGEMASKALIRTPDMLILRVRYPGRTQDWQVPADTKSIAEAIIFRDQHWSEEV